MTTKQGLLLVALSTIPACGDLSDIPTPVGRAIYRPDGTLAVFTQAGIKVYQGDLETETASIPVVSSEYWGTFDLSGDGSTASVVHSYGYDDSVMPPHPKQPSEVQLYGIPGGAKGQTVVLANLEEKAVLSPSSALVFASDSPGDPQGGLPGAYVDSLYRISDGARLWTIDQIAVHDQLGSSGYCGGGSWDRPPPVFSADEQTVYVPLFESVMAVDVASGTSRVFANARACIGWIDLLPDGTMLVLRGMAPLIPGIASASDIPADEAEDGSIGIYGPDGGQVREIPRFGDYDTAASIHATGSQVACTVAGDRCAMYVQQPRWSYDPTTGVSTQPTSGSLLVFGTDGTLVQLLPMSDIAGKMSFSPDGSRLAMPVGEGQNSFARVYRTADWSVMGERQYTNGVF